MVDVYFEYETTEGIVLDCSAHITPGRPERIHCLPEDAHPAEDPTIEITKIEVKDFTFAEEELQDAAWACLQGEQ